MDGHVLPQHAGVGVGARPHEAGLWNEEDGFYYDMLHLSDGTFLPLEVRCDLAHPYVITLGGHTHTVRYVPAESDSGAGVGASHQTGWTALVATLLQDTERA